MLIANDDGYLSPGIRTLHSALAEIGEAFVVAPDRNRSGASNSLTLSHPLLVAQREPTVWSVEGTPTDCIHVALGGLIDPEPDMVISGINDGPNMGDDVIYSGTVAAAIEGRNLGHPALAVSMGAFQPRHYDTAAHVVCRLIEQMLRDPLPSDTILNINVPDVPVSALKGFKVTRLGTRHPSQNAIAQKSPRGDTVYWIGTVGEVADTGPGTDFLAVADHWVSVTPLQIDLTRHDGIAPLGQWLEQLS